MKLLPILLSFTLVLGLNAQETDIRKDIKNSVEQIGQDGKQAILYVVQLDDQKLELPYTENIMVNLQPEMIDELNVIKKGKSAEFDAYRDKKVDGVIIIKLKNDLESKRFFDALKEKAAIEIVKVNKEDIDHEVKVRFRDSPELQPLIKVEIEGKVFTVDREILITDQLDPNNIENITVLKGEEALKIHKKAGENGVIIIKMKDNKAGKKLLKKLEEEQKKN